MYGINLSKPTQFSLFAVLLPIFIGVNSQITTVLSVAVPRWMQDVWGSTLFDDFEELHPGVEVAIVDPMGSEGHLPAFDINGYLESSVEVASSADVIYLSSSLYTEATRAGHYLDLKPLIDADSTLDVDDFYTPLVQSFQWDNGIWALPIAGELWVLSYAPEVFDAANIRYPDGNWTFNDFSYALEELYQTSLRNQTPTPSFFVATLNERMILLRSIFGTGFYDDSTSPATIDIGQTELAEVIDLLASFEENGIIQQFDPSSNSSTYALQNSPMRISPLSTVILGTIDSSVRNAAAPLLGGQVGVQAYGFAISSGTSNPDLAYEAIKYLTTAPEIASVYVYDVPAYRYPGIDTSTTEHVVPRNLTPEQEQLIEVALENGLPYSEFRYADYVALAYLNRYHEGTYALTALEDAQRTAVENSQLAALSRESLSITVVEPTLPPAPTSDEITLNFAIQSPILPLPNVSDWEQFFVDFAADDPQVGSVNFRNYLLLNSDTSNNYDCFFSTSNLVPLIGTDNLLDVSPLLDSDPNFDRDELFNKTLLPYQLDEKLLGIPIAIYPSIIWYDTQASSDMGFDFSQNNWAVEEFDSFISNSEVQPAFELRSSSISEILLLIASYGGLPFDYRTIPATIDVTSQETTSATGRVSSLIKGGTISQRLFDIFPGNSETNPIAFSDILDSNSFELAQSRYRETTDEPFRLTTFPVSQQYVPLSFTTGAGYINSSTLHPEACYRLINALSNEVVLYSAMPTRISVLDNLSTSSVIPGGLLDFYYNFAQSLQDPSAVIIPRVTNPELTWFQEALANHIVEGALLEEELVVVEDKINELRQCVGVVNPDPATISNVAALCAVQIDQAQ